MIKDLMRRRVPQILGLYIAATWMAIEIGDWMVDRFTLPANLTSYIFVGMIALLPAVAVVAWFHGSPGKDEWTKVEKAVLPANLVLAIIAVFYFVGPLAEVEATEIVEIVDETGAVQTFEVPRAGFHRKLSVFFWDNQTGDSQRDWLTYGLPVMLAHDLAHETPLVSAATPFGSEYLKEELRRRGFQDLSSVPRPLEVQLARGRQSTALVSGRIISAGKGIGVEVELVEVETGARLASLADSGADWFAMVDRISQGIRQALRLEDAQLGENDPLTDNLTGSATAAQKFVEALQAVELANDYPKAMAGLQAAISEDASFAEAYKQLGFIQFLSGASQDALASVDKALTHDYRLSLASKFELRATRYQFQQQVPAAIRVLEMWTEVQPENPIAFSRLGQLLMLQGDRHEEALAALARVLQLNPSAHNIFLTQALVEQSRGGFDQAAQLIQKYISERPDDADAYLRLARVYLAAGRHDDARKAYQDAAILAADTLLPELGLANLDIRLGAPSDAMARLDALLARELTPTQRVQVLNVVFEAQYVQGKMQDTLVTLATMDEEAKQFLPPLLRIIQIGSAMANSRALLGRFDEARASIAEMRAQMQAPFDGYLAFGLLGLEAEAGNEEAYMAALEDAVQFYEASGNELLTPFVHYGRAYGKFLLGENERALALAREALTSFDRSFIKTLSDSLVNFESKVQVATLLTDLGAYDEAGTALQELARQAPALGTVKYELARLALARGDEERARRYIGEALAIWKDADADYIRYARAKSLRESL